MERKKSFWMFGQWMVASFVVSTAYLTVDNRGKSFLLPFIENFSNQSKFALVITSESDATIYVNDPTQPEPLRELGYELLAGTSQHLELTSAVAVIPNSPAQKKAVMIVASQPVSVNAYSLELRSSDGYLALPVETLGVHYMVVTYNNWNNTGRVAVAAVENDTDVTLTLRLGVPQATCGSLPVKDGQQITYRLQAQEVASIQCSGNDFTGSIITSTKPVAVVAGNTCTSIQRLFNDHLMEMMVPTSAIGTQYLLHPFSGRDNGARYRILLRDSNTRVTYTPAITANTSRLFFQEVAVSQDQMVLVTADKPVLVAGFAMGQGSEPTNFLGDPFMAVMPPLDRAPASYLLDLGVTSAGRGFTSHVTVVIRREFSDGIMIGKDKLPTVKAVGDFYIGSVSRNTWPVNIFHTNATATFTALSYGFNDGEGFGFPAGLAVPDFSGVEECLSSPCQNGGICYEVGTRYRCRCADGFRGASCELDITLTTTVPSRSIPTTVSTIPTAAATTTTTTTLITSTPSATTTTPIATTTTIPTTTATTAESTSTTTTRYTTTTTPTTSMTTTRYTTTTTPTTSMTTTRYTTTTTPTTSMTTTRYTTTTQTTLATTTTTNATSTPPTTRPTTSPLNTTATVAASTATTSRGREVAHRPAYLCPRACAIMAQRPQLHDAVLLAETQNDVRREIEEELSLDLKLTSKVRSRHVTASDRRLSAAGVGLAGMTLLVFVTGFVVAMDAATFLAYLAGRIRRRWQRTAKKQRAFEDAGITRPSGSGAGQLRVGGTAALSGSIDGPRRATHVHPAEVGGFVDSVAMATHPLQRPGSSRKHLMHVRPETILLHVHGNQTTGRQRLFPE